jgi:lipoate-protein ligase A
MDARLIVDEPHDGAWNMAVDEALAHQAGESGVPVLRLYQWAEPTLSLGYFQAYSDREAHVTSRECTVVRRSSGGGALIHDREWTYSLAIPRREFDSPLGNELYQIVHGTLTQCLQNQGVSIAPWGQPALEERESEFLCFRRRTPHDLILDGHKVVGSAQRKRRHVVMQHGGVLLAQSACAPELPGIAELAKPVDEERLLYEWIDALTNKLSWRIRHSETNDAEKELANHLRNSRFSSKEWTGKRN